MKWPLPDITCERYVKQVSVALFGGVCLFSSLVHASVPEAYTSVGQQYGVPGDVLYAIAMTESRYYLGAGISRPWPWTANVAGKPYFFRTQQEMVAFLKVLLQQGNRRFDVGLMQISWLHHGYRFAGLEDAIDPTTNLQAGAAYLRYLTRRQGLDKAIGMYHAGEAGPAVRQEHYKQLVYQSLERIRKGQL